MDQLLDGYRRFRADTWGREREQFKELSREGQRPHTFVIACSDSRVDPQMIFDAGPGELFVARNVANLVPPYAPDKAYHGTSAAIEFAVRGLKVENIVVMGHAQCGGIHALLHGAPPEAREFVEPWIHIADPAREQAMKVPEEQRQGVCEEGAVRVSLTNLMTFPWISEAVARGELALHGCHFGIANGRLRWLGQDGVFQEISAVR